jgi:hypothetical protein
MVGVFKDRTVAEHAMDALYNAGFKQEQIRYSAPGVASGFFEDLKSLFTGTDADNLANNLISMGLSDEEAHYYVGEYTNGSTIIAVNAPDREQEALNVLRQYGAYNTLNTASTTTNYGAQPQTQTVEEHPVEDHQAGEVTSEHTTENPTPPVVAATPEDHTAYQAPPQDDVTTSEQEAEREVPPTNMATSESDVAHQSAQDSVVTPEHDAVYEAPQDSVVTPEYDAAYEEAPQDDVSTSEQGAMAPTPQPTPAAPMHTSYWEQLQEQLQTTQQQLDETKARLQAAKEREGQIQGAKQRLQDLQSELQAALAELQETESRIEQYR